MAKIVDFEKPFVEKALNEIFEKLHSDKFSFVSFVVRKPESDEFLLRSEGYKGGELYHWSKSTPSKAKRIARLKKAQKFAAEIGGDARAEILFESNEQFISIFTNEE